MILIYSLNHILKNLMINKKRVILFLYQKNLKLQVGKDLKIIHYYFKKKKLVKKVKLSLNLLFL